MVADPPRETRLYRKEHSAWGVPSGALMQVAFVLDVLRRDFGMGHAVRAVKWFHAADALAQEGDQDVFRAPEVEGGYVARAEPGVIWLRRELCLLPPAVLTRTLVHEVMHVEQFARGTRLPVDELEREADDLVAILCRGLG